MGFKFNGTGTPCPIKLFRYNWQLSHGGIDSLTPMLKCAKHSAQIPWSWEVWNDYHPENEPERIRNYAEDKPSWN